MRARYIDPKAMALLKAGLRVLAKAPPAPVGKGDNAEGENREAPEAAESQAEEEGEQVPYSVYALRQRAKRLHKEFDALRADLRHAGSDKDRYEIARRLMSDVTPALDAIYTQLRAFAKTGTPPPHPDIDAVRDDVAAEVFAYERLHNRAKRGKDKLTDEERARLAVLRKRYNRMREASYKTKPAA